MPLVQLETLEVTGYEAFARGPSGSPLESPGALFEAAEQAGRVAELDWICRAAAYRAALAGGLHPSLSVFVNTDPRALEGECPRDLLSTIWRAEGKLRVVMEVSERALATAPAEVLGAAARARRVGWGVALDNVGAEPRTLALMPFVAPDVIKVDLPLLHDRSDQQVALVVNAVLAQAERSGATVLAEGIETQRHLALARAIGAKVGQGFLFGQPGPLPPPGQRPHRTVRLLPESPAVELTPFELVSQIRPVRTAPKSLLISMSQHLENQGLGSPEPPVVLANFRRASYLTARTRARYSALAERAAFTGLLGPGMAAEPVRGAYGVAPPLGDPIRNEWDVIVVTPHFTGALVAIDHFTTIPEPDRRFTFVVTYDRDLVLESARSLLA